MTLRSVDHSRFRWCCAASKSTHTASLALLMTGYCRIFGILLVFEVGKVPAWLAFLRSILHILAPPTSGPTACILLQRCLQHFFVTPTSAFTVVPRALFTRGERSCEIGLKSGSAGLILAVSM